MKKCIVTVLGKDTVGIVAKVCTYLAENKINVLDISQTIIQGYFNMMVIVDVTELPKDFTVELFQIRINTIEKTDAERNRSYIQILMLDHFISFGNFIHIDQGGK